MLVICSAFVLGLAMLVQAQTASATLTGSDFEGGDGNLVVDSTFDWNGFSATTWTGTAPNRTSTKTASGWKFLGIEDADATTSDNAFAGGTKQDDQCPTVIAAKAPNKDDLKRVYLSSKTAAGNGHTYLNLAWVRIPQNTTSPSAHVAFEFSQGSTACAGSDIVQRTAGDMLVVYDFEGGATDTPTINLSRWVTSGSCQVGSHKPPCWGPQVTLPPAQAEAKVNTTGSVADAISPSSPASVTLGTNEFGEASIDLTAAGVVPVGACAPFGKVFAVSRTSGESSTAQMKDLVGPANFSLSNCGAIKITKTRKHAADGSGDHPHAGVSFTVNGVTKQTDANGVACFDNLANGSYTVHETVPAGYVVDGNDKSVTVDNAAACTDASYGGETVSFHNTPLTDVAITIDSQVAGGTDTQVTCKASDNSTIGTLDTPATGDGTLNVDDLVPDTYTCTIVIDP